MLWTVFFAALAAAQGQNASSSMPTATSVTFDEGVPTDAPVPGDYTGALRPQIHFSPPSNFMNDPNVSVQLLAWRVLFYRFIRTHFESYLKLVPLFFPL